MGKWCGVFIMFSIAPRVNTSLKYPAVEAICFIGSNVNWRLIINPMQISGHIIDRLAATTTGKRYKKRNNKCNQKAKREMKVRMKSPTKIFNISNVLFGCTYSKSKDRWELTSTKAVPIVSALRKVTSSSRSPIKSSRSRFYTQEQFCFKVKMSLGTLKYSDRWNSEEQSLPSLSLLYLRREVRVCVLENPPCSACLSLVWISSGFVCAELFKLCEFCS